MNQTPTQDIHLQCHYWRTYWGTDGLVLNGHLIRLNLNSTLTQTV